LELGIYYSRKSVWRFSENKGSGYHNPNSYRMLRIVLLGRRNRNRRFFLSKSMPDSNFAKVQL
jgi:hypothetical protein